ncbi:hypothetical protein GCM10023214_25910 [Amycolatopsis dongchuanensis]|uniref:Uncharacterized protein n=1 Tax=Amycolatopsis dongchuanensis TaxID=1070866 RepID=A0ABP9QFP7_9PSEU
MSPAAPPRFDQDGGDQPGAPGVPGQFARGARDLLLGRGPGHAEADGVDAFGGDIDRGGGVRDRLGPLLLGGRFERGQRLLAEQVGVGGAPRDELDAGDLRSVLGHGGADCGFWHGPDTSDPVFVGGCWHDDSRWTR